MYVYMPLLQKWYMQYVNVLSKLPPEKAEGKPDQLPLEVQVVLGDYMRINSDKADVTTLTKARHSDMITLYGNLQKHYLSLKGQMQFK